MPVKTGGKRKMRSGKETVTLKDSDMMPDITPGMTFDEAFSLLRDEAEKIGSDEISLEDAIESYRRGKAYYEFCRKQLNEAEQTIRIFDRDSGELKTMNPDGEAAKSVENTGGGAGQ